MTALGNDLYFMFLSQKFEFSNHLRRKRLLIVGVFAIMIPVLLSFLITLPGTAEQFASHILFSTSSLIVVLGALFASDSISGELEKKTGLLLFPTPQRRVSIFSGKYLAAVAITLIVISLHYAVVIGLVIIFYDSGSIPGALAKSYLLAALYSCSVISIIYSFSCIFKKNVVSALLSLFFLFLILPGFSMLLGYLEIERWFIVTYTANLITDILRVNTLNPASGEVLNIYASQPTFGVGIIVMIVYTIIFFAAGTWIANRKDMV